MALAVIKHVQRLPAGVIPAEIRGTLRLIASTAGDDQGFVTGHYQAVGGERVQKADSTGTITFSGVNPNSGASIDVVDAPANTRYGLRIHQLTGARYTPIGDEIIIRVADTDTVQYTTDILDVIPTDLAPSISSGNVAVGTVAGLDATDLEGMLTELAADASGHAGGADPHNQYKNSVRDSQAIERHNLEVLRKAHRGLARAKAGGGKFFALWVGDSKSEGWTGDPANDLTAFAVVAQKSLAYRLGLRGRYGKTVPAGTGFYNNPQPSALGYSTYLATTYTSGDGFMNVGDTTNFPASGSATITIPFVTAQTMTWTGKTPTTFTGVTLAGTWPASGTSVTIEWGGTNVATGYQTRGRRIPCDGPPLTLTFTGTGYTVRYRMRNAIGTARIRITENGVQVLETTTSKQTGTWCSLSGGQEVAEYTQLGLTRGAHTIQVDSIAGGPFNNSDILVDSIRYHDGDETTLLFVNASHFGTNLSYNVANNNPTLNTGWLSAIRQGLDPVPDLIVVAHGTNTGDTPATLLSQWSDFLDDIHALMVELGVAAERWPSIMWALPPSSGTKTNWDACVDLMYENVDGLSMPFGIVDWAEFTGHIDQPGGDPLDWTSGNYTHENAEAHRVIGEFMDQQLFGRYTNELAALDTIWTELDTQSTNLTGFGIAVLSLLDGKQPLDTDLTAIAALTTTAFGRGLLELADAAAVRSALGLGSAATSQPTDGETTIPRYVPTSNVGGMLSQQMVLSYFRAAKTETIGKLRFFSGTTPAAATPTLVKFAVFEEDEATGNLTRVGVTANDTTLLAVANTPYTRDLLAPWAKVAGRRYALAVLIVTAATVPTMTGTVQVVSLTAELGNAPRVQGQVTGLADVPASVAVASIVNRVQNYYARALA